MDSHTLIVQDNEKDVWKISSIVQKSLVKLINVSKTGLVDQDNMLKSFELSPSSKSLRAFFTLRGEDHQLYIHFDCDCDASHIPGGKILLSLYDWKDAKFILEQIGKAFQSEGYTVHNK
ncbi:hypothetical protein ACQ4M3_37190 [Leptolyngbya sp. AN03gr2]|uniref:hypothetical protein n=1 Tax=unclassified Leptolyngbya TaxID=2650499 RepID=UPI003D31BE98